MPNPIDAYIRIAAESLPKRHALEIAARIKPGELGCVECGHVDQASAFRYGRGRHQGEHPEHRYCGACGRSIDYYGFVNGDRIARNRASQAKAS